MKVFCGRAALLASLCVGFSWPVSCWANLVTNGGFETGSFGSTWGSFGDTEVCRISGCGSVGAFGSSAVDGTYAVVFADTTGTSSNEILTHFATTIGDYYTVSFDFGVESLSQNLTSQLLAPTGDTVLASSVFGPVASDPNGLDPYSWTFQAQYSTSYVAFFYDNAYHFDPGYIDNVDAEPGDMAVSEPASLGLVLMGVAATLVAARRRRVAAL